MAMEASREFCSNYLAAQPVDATLYGFIHKPTIPFHPPANPHQPMIMVGPVRALHRFAAFFRSARR